jgi:hypothetical protein
MGYFTYLKSAAYLLKTPDFNTDRVYTLNLGV